MIENNYIPININKMYNHLKAIGIPQYYLSKIEWTSCIEDGYCVFVPSKGKNKNVICLKELNNKKNLFCTQHNNSKVNDNKIDEMEIDIITKQINDIKFDDRLSISRHSDYSNLKNMDLIDDTDIDIHNENDINIIWNNNNIDEFTRRVKKLYSNLIKYKFKKQNITQEKISNIITRFINTFIINDTKINVLDNREKMYIPYFLLNSFYNFFEDR